MEASSIFNLHSSIMTSHYQVRHYVPAAGYTRIFERRAEGLSLDYGVVHLGRGEAFFEDTGDNEVMLIVLTGRCELLVGHNGNKAHGIIGERTTVFDGRAYRVYVPYRTTYELIAHDTPVEVAVCKTASDIDAAALILAPGETQDGSPYLLTAAEMVAHTTIAGGAIGHFRFRQASEFAAVRLIGHGEAQVRVGHNDVLALPDDWRVMSLESAGRFYSLWVEGRGSGEARKH